MHFLWSIFFTFCLTGLVFTYFLAIGMVIQTLRDLKSVLGKRGSAPGYLLIWKGIAAWIKNTLIGLPGSKAALLLLMSLLCFNSFLFVFERVRWMGEDNAHLTAKEYWVAGQVVNRYRRLIYQVSHVDKPPIQPFNRLQEWIYNKGIQYLPPDDGELGVWTDLWFIYPYSRIFSNTKGTQHHGYTPYQPMMDLVDRTWFSLARQANFEFADSRMRVQYMKGFPGQAYYYAIKNGHLTGQYLGSARLAAQNHRLLERNRQMVIWLENLKTQWETSPELKAFVQKHPKLEAIRQINLQMTAGRVAEGTIHSREFNCDSKEVRDYIRFRGEFLGLLGDTEAAVYRMKDRTQAKTLLGTSTDVHISRFWSHVLKRFCQLSVPGKTNRRRNERPEDIIRKVESLFHREIKILEEIDNGR